MSIKLNVVYEDDEVIVLKAPHEDELVDLVYNFIKQKGRPVKWSELREAFSGIAGEDRLRRALHRLRRDGLIVELRGGRYATPDMPGVLEELERRMKKRILREALGLDWRYYKRRATN